MTDFASLLLADRGQRAQPIHLVDEKSFPEWLKKRPAEDRALLQAQRFDGKTAYAFALMPRSNELEVVSAVRNAAELSPWCLAKLGESLPEGTYKLASGDAGIAALGRLLAQHRFEAYRYNKDARDPGGRLPVLGEGGTTDATVSFAKPPPLFGDWVNTTAGDLGPVEIE